MPLAGPVLSHQRVVGAPLPGACDSAAHPTVTTQVKKVIDDYVVVATLGFDDN